MSYTPQQHLRAILNNATERVLRHEKRWSKAKQQWAAQWAALPHLPHVDLNTIMHCYHQRALISLGRVQRQYSLKASFHMLLWNLRSSTSFTYQNLHLKRNVIIYGYLGCASQMLSRVWAAQTQYRGMRTMTVAAKPRIDCRTSGEAHAQFLTG